MASPSQADTHNDAHIALTSVEATEGHTNQVLQPPGPPSSAASMMSISTVTPSTFSTDNDADSFQTGNSSLITADDNLSELDEGYADSLNTSYVSSMASNIRRGVLENGRIYPDYGKHMYGFPMDDKEQDRLDLQHSKYYLLMNGRLHLAPISESPQKILDLGTGTGIWAIDVADKYPSAQITGVDIAPIAPSWIPPNCMFEIEDIESDWTWRTGVYDFIHARELMLAVRDWDRLISQSYERLKPGGWMEMSGTVISISSDDNTIPENSAYIEGQKIICDVGAIMNTPISTPYTWKDRLAKSGFVNIKEVILKIPLGPWPRDKRLKQIGAIELMHLHEGLEAYILRAYTQVLGGSTEDLQILLARVRQELVDPKMHSYVYYVVTYAQKPDNPSPAV